uniref:EF-hand domain-containing protein n=1 Tax=Globisporangium ultimum (strain ATCC 200006 / CBS 805.95 / DAOM BR144) TaxID=431595 RepID=K3W533_GLOUD
MSTLTSADFGELKRPTTRVHAPPGGGSSWSFGGDAPAPPQRAAKPSEDVNMENSSAAAVAPPAPVSSASSVAAASVNASPAAAVRIALVKTKVDADIVDGMTQNAVEKLQQNPQVSTQTFTVASLDELPYAANKLTHSSKFDSVIVFGFLNTSDPLFNVLSTTLTQSFIDISVKNVKPVIRGIFIGEPRVAGVKVRGGYGAEFAEDIDALVNLGGFVGPIVHFAEGKQVKKQVQISRGNILPPKLLGASRTIIQTLELLRNSLYEHGARGIAGLGRKFRIIDDDGNRQLNLDEFRKAIHEHALDLSEAETKELFEFIDTDNSGGINFDEFLIAIRGELNDRRQQLVLLAFNILDADGSGIIELNDIQAKYNADKHPDVLSGAKTKDDIFREFLDTFDGGEKDGKVHPNEFIRYYANVSASIDDDDYFELMIRNAWHISGGEGWSANTTCRRVLVTHADGTQTIEEVKNDIGIAANNVEAVRANLQAQGINDIQSVEGSSGYVESRNDINKRSADPFEPKFVKKKQHGAGASSIVFG